MSATNRPFLFRITEDARQFLLDEGTDERYGARHLKRAIERFLIHPLASLLATGQLLPGDILIVDRRPEQKCLAFSKGMDGNISYARAPLMDRNFIRQMDAAIQARSEMVFSNTTKLVQPDLLPPYGQCPHHGNQEPKPGARFIATTTT